MGNTDPPNKTLRFSPARPSPQHAPAWVPEGCPPPTLRQGTTTSSFPQRQAPVSTCQIKARWARGVHRGDGYDLPGEDTNTWDTGACRRPAGTTALVSLCQACLKKRGLRSTHLHLNTNAAWILAEPVGPTKTRNRVQFVGLAIDGCELLESPHRPRWDRAGGAARPAPRRLSR